jgi:hypothetical protein
MFKSFSVLDSSSWNDVQKLNKKSKHTFLLFACKQTKNVSNSFVGSEQAVIHLTAEDGT